MGTNGSVIQIEYRNLINFQVDVNIKGVLNGVGAVLPSMVERKAGDIINISSGM